MRRLTLLLGPMNRVRRLAVLLGPMNRVRWLIPLLGTKLIEYQDSQTNRHLTADQRN